MTDALYAYQMVSFVMFEPHMHEWLDRLASYDSDTFYHSIRVATYSALYGKKLSLSFMDMQNLLMGSLLHDIGKLKVLAKMFRYCGQFYLSYSHILFYRFLHLDVKNIVKIM